MQDKRKKPRRSCVVYNEHGMFASCDWESLGFRISCSCGSALWIYCMLPLLKVSAGGFDQRIHSLKPVLFAESSASTLAMRRMRRPCLRQVKHTIRLKTKPIQSPPGCATYRNILVLTPRQMLAHSISFRSPSVQILYQGVVPDLKQAQERGIHSDLW